MGYYPPPRIAPHLVLRHCFQTIWRAETDEIQIQEFPNQLKLISVKLNGINGWPKQENANLDYKRQTINIFKPKQLDM